MKQGIFRALYATIVAVFLCFAALAQTAAYTVHTIVPGESLSSLARDYHTTVGDIMRLNDMHTDSKLALGMKLKIPATSEPVQRETVVPKAPTAAPATSTEARTHTVQTGESLYRISKIYGLSVEKLMALNHIEDGGSIKVGQVLLVSDGTAPAQPAKAAAEATPLPPAPKPAQETKQTAAPAATTTPTPAVAEKAQTTETKKEDIPVYNPPTPTPSTAPPTPQSAFAGNVSAPKEGFFTAQYKQNTEGRSEQTKTGAAMTFKSASGWADKKFYILMNDAPPGSIVKVKKGNSVVYAKVLWSLGTQKENEGLDFRISTASAAALNITDEKFEVAVTYYQ